MPNVTRGNGFLEEFLAKKRAQTADRLISKESRKGRVLDIGCGLYPLFLVNTEFSEKHGVDQAIEEAVYGENSSERIFVRNYCIETGGTMPYDSGHFDVVTMLAVVEHLHPENLATLLSEAHRLLKKGGTLVLTTPAGWTCWILKTLAAIRLVSTEEISDHKTSYYPSTLLPAVIQAGFSHRKIRYGYFELFMNFWLTVEK